MGRDHYIFFIVPVLKIVTNIHSFIFVVVFVVAIAEAVVIGDIC